MTDIYWVFTTSGSEKPRRNRTVRCIGEGGMCIAMVGEESGLRHHISLRIIEVGKQHSFATSDLCTFFENNEHCIYADVRCSEMPGCVRHQGMYIGLRRHDMASGAHKMPTGMCKVQLVYRIV